METSLEVLLILKQWPSCAQALALLNENSDILLQKQPCPEPDLTEEIIFQQPSPAQCTKFQASHKRAKSHQYLGDYWLAKPFLQKNLLQKSHIKSQNSGKAHSNCIQERIIKPHAFHALAQPPPSTKPAQRQYVQHYSSTQAAVPLPATTTSSFPWSPAAPSSPYHSWQTLSEVAALE